MSTNPVHVTLEMGDDGPSYDEKLWNRYWDYCASSGDRVSVTSLRLTRCPPPPSRPRL